MKLTLHGSASTSEVVVVVVVEVVVVVVVMVEVVEMVVVVEQAWWEKREGINQEIHAVKKTMFGWCTNKTTRTHSHTLPEERLSQARKRGAAPCGGVACGFRKKRECGSMQDTPAPPKKTTRVSNVWTRGGGGHLAGSGPAGRRAWPAGMPLASVEGTRWEARPQ